MLHPSCSPAPSTLPKATLLPKLLRNPNRLSASMLCKYDLGKFQVVCTMLDLPHCSSIVMCIPAQTIEGPTACFSMEVRRYCQ